MTAHQLIVRRITMKQEGWAGWKVPFLVDADTGWPHEPVMNWVLITRLGVVATNTIDRELYALALFEKWKDRVGLSTDDPFAFAQGFTPTLIYGSLRPYLARSFSRGEVRALTVSANHCNARLTAVKAYVIWQLTNAQHAFSAYGDAAQIAALEIQKGNIEKALNDAQSAANVSKPALSLTDEQQRELLRVIDPELKLIDWGHGDGELAQAVRVRNEIIILLEAAFGLRRGELLKLCTEDVTIDGRAPTLQVRRRPNDPWDRRKQEPQVKTLERVLPLSDELARRLDDFIRNARRKFPSAKKSPYLFLSSRDGAELSLRSLNDVFIPLRAYFPGIHPHAMRHTFNEWMKRQASQFGLTEAMALQHAKYLNGWLNDNSGLYTQAERRREAQAMSLAYQQKLFARSHTASS